MIDFDYEYANPKATDYARKGWDNCPPDVAAHDRLMLLQYVTGDLFMELDTLDVVDKKFDELPTMLQWRLALLVQRTLRLVNHGRTT